MRLSTRRIRLRPKHAFATSHERTVESESVIVRIEHSGVCGLGEAKATADSCGGADEDVCDMVAEAADVMGDDPFQIEDILDRIALAFPGAPCTLAGIDIALHDLCGKLLGVPLYRMFGLNLDRTPRTSFTLGLDDPDAVLQKLEEARGCPILKIKVGVPGDVEIVRAIRERSSAVLRVDANGGWTVGEAIERIRQIEPLGIEMVEQPIAPGNPDGLREIRSRTTIPIVADEDAHSSRDLPLLAGCVDGINIKLMECGGLREALRMIHVAHALGMDVMLGCMMESSLSLTAAAHLSPLAEYGDLDSHLLLEDDPFVGLGVRNGKIVLPETPGIGVVDRRKA